MTGLVAVHRRAHGYLCPVCGGPQSPIAMMATLGGFLRMRLHDDLGCDGCGARLVLKPTYDRIVTLGFQLLHAVILIIATLMR